MLRNFAACQACDLDCPPHCAHTGAVELCNNLINPSVNIQAGKVLATHQYALASKDHRACGPLGNRSLVCMRKFCKLFCRGLRGRGEAAHEVGETQPQKALRRREKAPSNQAVHLNREERGDLGRRGSLDDGLLQEREY